MKRVKFIGLSKIDERDAEELIVDLSEILASVGVSISVSGDAAKMLRVEYDLQESKKKYGRGAGAHYKVAQKSMTVVEARSRMKSGELAEKLAAEMGISRRTFFQRLKKSEEDGKEFII